MKTSITREGILYLLMVIAILVGALVREVNTTLLFASFLFAPLLLAFPMGRRAIKKITIRRTIPSRIFAGETFIVGMEAANTSPVKKRSLSCWSLVVIDRIHRIRQNENTSQEKPYEPAIYFNYIPNGQTRHQTYAGNLPQRGCYQFMNVQISTRFPFGFFWNHYEQAPNEKTNEFYVYPRIGKLSNRWKSERQKVSESQQRLRFQPSRQIADFLGVRPWQSGDTKKSIHWRASAKHQVPVVRQYERHRNQDCAIILDLFHEGDWTPQHRENFELAVSFAATIVSDWTRRSEGNIFFATNAAPEESVYAPLGAPTQDQILRHLTFASPSPDDNLAETMLRIPAHHQSEIIFVTANALNIHTSQRFKEFIEDSRYRGLLRRLFVVDTSSKELENYFVP